MGQIGCADYRVNPQRGAFILGENVKNFVTYFLGLGFCVVRFQNHVKLIIQKAFNWRKKRTDHCTAPCWNSIHVGFFTCHTCSFLWKPPMLHWHNVVKAVMKLTLLFSSKSSKTMKYNFCSAYPSRVPDVSWVSVLHVLG